MKGTVVKSTGSWYSVKIEGDQILLCRLRGKFKLVEKKITNPIAVGDFVIVEEFSDKDYIIVEILPRQNYVVRISPRKKGFHHLIATNIDQALLMTSLKSPRTSIGFIDRFLVTLETFRIPGIIVVNKVDLYSDHEKQYMEELSQIYQGIGYRTVFTSVVNGEIQGIKNLLAGKTSLIAGHSGTGKSSLVNTLIPSVKQSIKPISDFADKGVHTTTFAEMFALDEHTNIIDTPGIKELGLAEIGDEELSHYFPEMRELIGHCKFNDCSHTVEPGCALITALENGEISEGRFDSYLSMLEADDNRR